MNAFPGRVLFMVLAVGLASMLSLVLRPSQAARAPLPPLESLIPNEFAEWKVDPSIVPIKPAPDVQARLDRIYDAVLARTYVNGRGYRVMLSIAYGGEQSDALKAHRQELCYAAQGFTIRSVSSGALQALNPPLPVVHVDAVMGDRFEPVTYWLTVGGRPVIGRAERLILQIRHGLMGSLPDGMLVRVSSLDRQADNAYAAQQEFVVALSHAVSDGRLRESMGFGH